MRLCAFGTFWTGEGMGYAWPYGDLAILGLIAGWLLVALLGVRLCRQQPVAAEPRAST